MFVMLMLCVVFVAAQERKRVPLMSPVYRGWSVHADVASPVMGIVAAPGTANVEVLADVNLYDRFFPVFELGYTSLSKDINGSEYNAQAQFFRLGMNFNIIKTVSNKGIYKENRSYAYLGVRYAFSLLDYSLNNVVVENPYWNTSYVKDFNNPMTYCGWAEIHGGVRMDLAKGFTMGWSVGIRFLMHNTADIKEAVWYVPGYGKNNAINFAFKYTIGFTMRTKKARELAGKEIKVM